MIFGRDWEPDWPANVQTTDVHLYLKCPDASGRIQHSEAGVQFFAQTWLETNATYRLTWSPRYPLAISQTPHQVDFQLKGTIEGNAERSTVVHRAWLCEVLYEDNGVQFLGRTVRPSLYSSDQHRHEMPAIGFTKDGQSVDPPDTGYRRVKRAVEQVRLSNGTKQKPPPAMTTHHPGFSLEGDRAAVRVSDTGTWTELPDEPDEHAFVLFCDHLCRIELLTSNIEILRVDREFWHQRTMQIRDEWANESRP